DIQGDSKVSHPVETCKVCAPSQVISVGATPAPAPLSSLRNHADDSLISTSPCPHFLLPPRMRRGSPSQSFERPVQYRRKRRRADSPGKRGATIPVHRIHHH